MVIILSIEIIHIMHIIIVMCYYNNYFFRFIPRATMAILPGEKARHKRLTSESPSSSTLLCRRCGGRRRLALLGAAGRLSGGRLGGLALAILPQCCVFAVGVGVGCRRRSRQRWRLRRRRRRRRWLLSWLCRVG